MVGTKLNELKLEISHYLGIPYFTNKGKFKNHGDNVLVGKGTAKEIALKTVEIANDQNVILIDLSLKDFYNFQKKNHIGIDCSGLASNLLNFYGNLNSKKIDINPRRTSADMLTTLPISHQVKDLSKIQTGDLVRQKNGHHILFIIEKIDTTVYYVESSQDSGGVVNGYFKLDDKNFIYDGIYRLFLFD